MSSKFLFILFPFVLILNCSKKDNIPVLSEITIYKTLEMGGYSAPPEKAFYKIGDLALDQNGNIFVADIGNVRIQKFDSKGNYLQTIGKQGRGPGELSLFFYLELDDFGNLYVADVSNARIQKYTNSGKYLKSLNVAFQYGADIDIQGEKIFFRKQYMKDHLLLETDTSLSYIKPIISTDFIGHKDFISLRGINYSFAVTPEYDFIFFNNFTKKFYLFNYEGKLLKEFEIRNQELQNFILEDIERIESKKKGKRTKSNIVVERIGSLPIFSNLKFYDDFIYGMYIRSTEGTKEIISHSILYKIDLRGYFLEKYIGFQNSWHTFALDHHRNIFAIDFEESKVIKYKK